MEIFLPVFFAIIAANAVLGFVKMMEEIMSIWSKDKEYKHR